MTDYTNNAAINTIVPAFLAMANSDQFFEPSGKYQVWIDVEGELVICYLQMNFLGGVLHTDVLDTQFRDEVLRACRAELRKLVIHIDGPEADTSSDDMYWSACDPDSAEYAYRN